MKYFAAVVSLLLVASWLLFFLTESTHVHRQAVKIAASKELAETNVKFVADHNLSLTEYLEAVKQCAEKMQTDKTVRYLRCVQGKIESLGR